MTKVHAKFFPRQPTTVSWGVHLTFLCPEVIECFGLMGFQWLLLDAEHQPLNHQLCRDLIRVADGAGMWCMVRVPEINSFTIEGFLDAGALGILAPNISSAEQARALVAAVKFSPEGTRGAANKTRAAGYGLTQTPSEYARWANETIRAAALIESRDGVGNLHSILKVAGLDYVGIGPNDLGLSMGIDTGIVDPEVRALSESAQLTIGKAGKPRIMVVADGDRARTAVEAGAKLIAVSDIALLAEAGRSFFATASPIPPENPQLS